MMLLLTKEEVAAAQKRWESLSIESRMKIVQGKIGGIVDDVPF